MLRSTRTAALITWSLGIAAAALFLAISVQLAPLQPSVVALQAAATETAFRDILAQWQPAGVQRYRAHFPADFALLVLYGVFGFRVGRHALAAPGVARPWARVLMLALPLAAGADAVENALHLVLTAGASSGPAELYPLAAAAAAVKWLAIVAFGGSWGVVTFIRPR